MIESSPLPCSSESARDDFLDRFDGVHVTQSVTFGHPLTLRFFRRTFGATSRNYHYLAVMAPAVAQKPAPHFTNAHGRVAESLEQANQEAQHDTHELRALSNDAQPSEVGARGMSDPIAVKLITPMSGKHLALLRQSDALLLLLEQLWIQSCVSDEQRQRYQGRVKRRLTRVALIARETCVKLMRGDFSCNDRA